jgi:hypothetical protein
LRELRPEVSEYLVGGHRLNQAGVQFATSARNFFEPSLFGASIWGAIQFLKKGSQQALLFRIWKGANLLFDLGHCSGHSGAPVADPLSIPLTLE